jgi:DNA-binding NarL/FixJ family response regulator
MMVNFAKRQVSARSADNSEIRCIVLNRHHAPSSLNGGVYTGTRSNYRNAQNTQRDGIRMMRILIADGNDVVRKLLKLLIESREGWAVCGEAVDGKEALRKSRELKPDMVILDLAMPGLNGLLAAREISRILPTVPILLHTVNNIPAVVVEAKKFGIRRVVGKGQDGEVLLNAIQEELAAKPQGITALLNETPALAQTARGAAAAAGGPNEQASGAPDIPEGDRPHRSN